MLRARLWRLSCFGINQPAKVIVWSEKTKVKPDNGDKICYYLFIYLFIYLFLQPGNTVQNLITL